MNPNTLNSHGFIHALIKRVKDKSLRKTCEHLFCDVKYELFSSCPAALKWHHSEEGGLADHTLEVMEYALHLADIFGAEVNRDVIIAAAVWHDIAKIWEYRPSSMIPGTWEAAPYKHLVYHISGSYAEFIHVATKHKVSEDLKTAVGHAILAHHGPVREWGSPVAPQTLEATILHQADMLSANYGQTR